MSKRLDGSKYIKYQELKRAGILDQNCLLDLELQWHQSCWYHALSNAFGICLNFNTFKKLFGKFITTDTFLNHDKHEDMKALEDAEACGNDCFAKAIGSAKTTAFTLFLLSKFVPNTVTFLFSQDSGHVYNTRFMKQAFLGNDGYHYLDMVNLNLFTKYDDDGLFYIPYPEPINEDGTDADVRLWIRLKKIKRMMLSIKVTHEHKMHMINVFGKKIRMVVENNGEFTSVKGTKKYEDLGVSEAGGTSHHAIAITSRYEGRWCLKDSQGFVVPYISEVDLVRYFNHKTISEITMELPNLSKMHYSMKIINPYEHVVTVPYKKTYGMNIEKIKPKYVAPSIFHLPKNAHKKNLSTPELSFDDLVSQGLIQYGPQSRRRSRSRSRSRLPQFDDLVSQGLIHYGPRNRSRSRSRKLKSRKRKKRVASRKRSKK